MNLVVILSLLASLFGSSWNPTVTNYGSEPKTFHGTLPLEIFSKPHLQNKDAIFNGIEAKGLFLSNLNSGTVLAYKNPDQNFSTASITKLMTALVVLENYNSSEVVTVSYKAASINGSIIHLAAGEQIAVSQLILGMLIGSGNDAATALGEHFGEGDLVTLMNEKAKSLEMKNTHFADASGLSLENRSTPRDLTILTKAALKYQMISDAVKSLSATLTSADGITQHLIHTTNRLLKNYSDIFGVKTGYTDEAGFCLISLAERNGNKLLLVLLGSPSDDGRFDESRVILDRAFENITW